MFRKNDYYVTGSATRIFINPSLGCVAACQYCYLPNLGLQDIISYTTLDAIIRSINEKEKSGGFISGKNGTIVSFGCFTECWNKEVRQITKKAIEFILKKGNLVQIATKECIEEKDIKELSREMQYKNQLTIFVSVPCIKLSEIIEPFAEKVENRISTFMVNKKYDIDIILYIKPVLEDITIQSLDKYIDIIKKYNLMVVVGSYLKADFCDNVAVKIMVGNIKMQEQESQQRLWLIQQLAKYAKTYLSSTQLVESYRGNFDEISKGN